MTRQPARRLSIAALALLATVALPSIVLEPLDAHAQTVDDGSDAAIGKEDTRKVLALIKGYLDKANDAKVTALRRSKGSIVCGSVNVKNKDGLYLGERGFVADVSALTFGRVPEGVELLNPRADDYEEKEKIRELYFERCLD